MSEGEQDLKQSRPRIGSLPPESGVPSGLKVVTLSPPPDVSPETLIADGSFEWPRDPYLGATVDDRYNLEKVLGEGGMGVVYRCRHTIIDKQVAMKVLRADLAHDPEVTDRFLNEARAASTIGNPHIIDISDFGRFPDGSTYFVMEYLHGIPLSDLIDATNPVPATRIVHIMRQLAEGLAAAHKAGIVHRDLKPDNVFLIERGKEKDFVKILDFGIAKVSTHNHRLTRAGTVFGTPHYMAPEQAAGAPVDHRGDIYSLGVIMYELASGQVPFDADNFMGILTQHMYKEPPRFAALGTHPSPVPPGLEAIVLKCLSKRPEERYQTTEELLEDLSRFGAGEIPTAVPDLLARGDGFWVPADYFKRAAARLDPETGRPTRRSAGQNWTVYLGLAAALFTVGVIATLLVLGPRSGPVSAPSVSFGPRPSTDSAAPTVAVAPAVAARPARHQVIIATEPADAEVLRGDELLGTAPVAIRLDPDATVTLTARAPGYETQSRLVDTSSETVVIKLTRSPVPATTRQPRNPGPSSPGSTPGRARPSAESGALGGGVIVNPWDP